MLAAPAKAPSRGTFEAVRERVSPVGPRPYHGHEALRHAMVECRPHELIEGTTCSRCNHLLSAAPAPDGRSVHVRCVFFESDPVTTLMTRAVDLVSADETESVAVAAARMLDRDVEQVVVTSGGAAIGMLLARDVETAPRSGEEHIADRVVPLPVIPRSMTLALVAAAFRDNDLDCAAVLDGDELVGIITRGDLRRAGVPGL
jgi:CBS domain-containing protein